MKDRNESFKQERKRSRAHLRAELLAEWSRATEALLLDQEAPIGGLYRLAVELVEWAAWAGGVNVDHADQIFKAVQQRQMKLIRELVLQL